MVALILSQLWPETWWPQYGGPDYTNSHFSVLTGAMTTTPAYTEHNFGQPADSGGPEIAPYAGQIDADNSLEVVAPLQVGVVRAWDAVTNGLMWQTHLDGQFFRTTATVIDVDGDAALEVIMVGDTFWGSADYPGGTYCLNALTGSLEWVFRSAFGATSAKVMDIDGDGAYEIIVGSKNGNVYCLTGTGSVEWYYYAGGMADVPVAIADIDGDGQVEIVGASSSSVFTLNHDGTTLWATSTGPGRSAPTIIPDVNNDGHPDVVHHATAGGLYCYSGLDGSLIWQNSSVGSVYEVYAVNWHGTAAGDLDGDGSWEVITTDASANVWCVDAATGTTKWSVNTGASNGIHVAPSLFDIDGDGQVEIAVGGCCDQPEPLRVYNHDGTLLWQITFGNAHDMHDPANADVDADGCGELLVGVYDVSTGHNSVFILDDQQATNCGLLTEELPGPFPEPELKFTGESVVLALPYEGSVSLKLYDAAGRLAATLFEGRLGSGRHQLRLPSLPSGAYQAVLKFPLGSLSLRVIIK